MIRDRENSNHEARGVQGFIAGDAASASGPENYCVSEICH